jgi:pimeloyl-ACP methyl ester carboxylesterase
MTRILVSCAVAVLLVVFLIMSASAQPLNEITLSNQAGDTITSLTDGDLIRLTIELSEAVQEPITISFYLDSNTHHIIDCQILAGQRNCTSAPTGTLGWYWDRDAQVRPERMIYAIEYAVSGWRPIASLEVTVQSRPVVLVHGFGSTYTIWDSYLGPAGLLSRIGLRGYAVSDGQVTGTMLTGSLLKPSSTTNTIAQNATALGEYIANVKAETGAEQVDLIVHSMGGLISRYYIDRIMGQRDVAQLIMLGTPNGGSDCAILIGSLGLYQPAALELRSDYVRHVFNPQITEQRGIPFYIFAGTPIQQRIISPCSNTPHDMVVSLDSAASIPAELVEVPILHIHLNTSEELFTEYVAPLLRRPESEFTTQGEQSSLRIEAESEPVQFSQLYTGFVSTPEGNEHIINIDRNVAVASFGLFDPTRSLTVTVRGASGNVITLDPVRNGLTIIDDPASLIYLGYGFENPNPGPWRVTVHPTERTPPLGTEYAIVAQYGGGATIEASLSNHLPGVGEQVELTATLNVGDEPLDIGSVEVVVYHPDGHLETISVSESGTNALASWQPEQPGIYGIDVSMWSILPDATVVERTTFLALEAFDVPPDLRQ